jgi:hypothetical protein
MKVGAVVSTTKNEEKNMDQKQIQVMLLYVSIGLRVLSARIVLLLALALTFSLFAWAMYWPTHERIACATIFALLVFIPVIRMDSKLKSDRIVVAPEGAQNE